MLTKVLAGIQCVVFILTLAACGGALRSQLDLDEPTSVPSLDIDATVEARIQERLVSDATNELRTGTPGEPPTEVRWIIATDKEDTFSMLVPSGWVTNTDMEVLTEVLGGPGVLVFLTSADPQSGDNIIVMADVQELSKEEPEAVNLAEYVRLQVEDLKQSGLAGLTSTTRVTIDGISGTQIRYVMNGVRVTQNFLVGASDDFRTVCGSMPLLVQGTSISGESDIIEKSLSSFRVTPLSGGKGGPSCGQRNTLSLMSESE